MKRGFTLIELLVVIAVIGVLASVVLTSVSSARAKSRDNLRRQSLIQLRTALEIFYNDNGFYPYTVDDAAWYTSDPAGDPGTSHNNGNWIPGLVDSGAISELPQDPLGGTGFGGACGTTWHRAFLYRSTDGSGYNLLSNCAIEGTISPSDPFYYTPYAIHVCVAGTPPTNDCI